MAREPEAQQEQLPVAVVPMRRLGDAGIKTDVTPITDLIGKPLALTHAETSSSRQYGRGARMKVFEIGAAGLPNGQEHRIATFSEGVVRVVDELLAQSGKPSATFDPPFIITFRGSRETGYSVE